MDQVFNELSLSASLPDASSAWDALLNLKNASDKLKDLGFTANIRVTEKNIYSNPLLHWPGILPAPA